MRDAVPAERTQSSEYLIEVPHSPEECSAAEVAATGVGGRVLRSYRGCGEGTHTTWIVAELASEEEAWSLVPGLLRDTARVTRVDRSPPDSDSTEEPRGGRDERH
jgi:hypothetical protein